MRCMCWRNLHIHRGKVTTNWARSSLSTTLFTARAASSPSTEVWFLYVHVLAEVLLCPFVHEAARGIAREHPDDLVDVAGGAAWPEDGMEVLGGAVLGVELAPEPAEVLLVYTYKLYLLALPLGFQKSYKRCTCQALILIALPHT